MNRRTFLHAAAVCAAWIPLGGCAGRRPAAGQRHSRQGTAFGTQVVVTIAGFDTAESGELSAGAMARTREIEEMVSLTDPSSPLRVLNDTGMLEDPPPLLVALLRACDRMHRLTGAAFDPTVQPLWELYERHYALHPNAETGPSAGQIAEARSHVGWDKVEVSAERIQFRQAGMSLTLNGIAPGFAADRAADWLAERSVRHALIDAGEFRAIGAQPNGEPWRVRIRGAQGRTPIAEAMLNDNALASSGGYATAFDREARYHHLFNPRADRFQPARLTISVEAPLAADADALATAGGVMEWDDFLRVIEKLPETRARVFSEAGLIHQAAGPGFPPSKDPATPSS